MSVNVLQPLSMPVLQPLQFRQSAGNGVAPVASMAAPGSAPAAASGAAAVGSPSSIPNAVAGNPLMQANWQKANSVCTSLDDMLTTLAELYEVNSYWKQKFINCKKQHFQKFMGSSKHGLRGMVFAEWKAYTFETGTERKVEGKREDLARLHADGQALYEKRETELRQRMEDLEHHHQETIAEMSALIEKQNQEIGRLQESKNNINGKHEVAMGILMVMKEAVMNTNEDLYKVTSVDEDDEAKPFAENFEYAKQAMHDILNEVDPKYVPPVGSLCVGPPPAPVGTPLLRGVSQKLK